MSLFAFQKIENPSDRLSDVFRLRYQVYVKEWGFEDESAHPEGLEKNIFDEHSLHIAAVRKDCDQIIGSARIVCHSHLGFPIEDHMTIEPPVSEKIRIKTGEISRLAISKEFSQRAEDKVFQGQSSAPPPKLPVPNERREKENDLVMGLYRQICYQSRLAGLTHWYVAMAKGLDILLRRKKIYFPHAGPEIDYHGLRKPYFGEISSILAKNQELLDIYLGRIDLDENGEGIDFCQKESQTLKAQAMCL